MTNLMLELAELNDDELHSQLDALVRRDRRNTALIVAHLSEIDARKLYLERGCGSMIDYGQRVLGFSESAAYRCLTAARLVRRFPVLLDRIEAGAIHLTALTILGPHLDDDNVERLVTAASGKSRLELEALVAPLRPPEPQSPRAIVRVVRLPEGPVARDHEASLFDPPGNAESVGAAAAGSLKEADTRAEGNSAAAVSGVDVSAPLAPGPTTAACANPTRLAYRLSATLSPETKALLDRAAELLGREVRKGDVDSVLLRALRLLVDTTEARRFGKVRRPRVAQPKRSPSRAIPAAVRRGVAERDGGRCTFVASDGRRCPERGVLEYHHRRPLAHGGPTSVDNLTLLCAAHHRRVSEQQFGRFVARDAPRGGARYGNSRQARVGADQGNERTRSHGTRGSEDSPATWIRARTHPERSPSPGSVGCTTVGNRASIASSTDRAMSIASTTSATSGSSESPG
jgi:5-methylcytosine-specific restriction endonuclease McrA